MGNAGLEPLTARVGSDATLAAVTDGDGWTTVSLMALESDIAAGEGLKATAIAKLQEMTIGEELDVPVRRVRVADILGRPIHTPDELKAAIEELTDVLQKLIDEGNAIILE